MDDRPGRPSRCVRVPMTNNPLLPPDDDLGLTPSAAAALDAALDAVQAGRSVDRDGLLARYPDLGDAVAALDQLLTPRGQPGAFDETVDASVGSLVAPPPEIGPYRIERELGRG